MNTTIGWTVTLDDIPTLRRDVTVPTELYDVAERHLTQIGQSALEDTLTLDPDTPEAVTLTVKELVAIWNSVLDIFVPAASADPDGESRGAIRMIEVPTQSTEKYLRQLARIAGFSCEVLDVGFSDGESTGSTEYSDGSVVYSDDPEAPATVTTSISEPAPEPTKMTLDPVPGQRDINTSGVTLDADWILPETQFAVVSVAALPSASKGTPVRTINLNVFSNRS